jgi:PAS domain S-box-containing protein
MAQQLQALFSSLKSSEEQYMNLFQSSADAILLFEGFILQKINRAGEEMFSLSEEEAKGKNARELLGEVGAGIGESIESSYIAQNGGYQDLTISRAIGGRDQYLNVRTKKIEADLKTMSLVLVRDITEERKAIISFAEQDALRESYSQIEMFLRYLPDPTFVTDAEGKTLIWNQAMEEMTEIKSEEMTGNSNFMYSDSVHHLKYPNLP